MNRLKALCTVAEQLLLPHLPICGEPVLVTGHLAAELVQFIGEKQPHALCEIKSADYFVDQQAPSAKFSLVLVLHRFGLGGVEDEVAIGKNLISRVRDVFAERVLHLVISDPVTGNGTFPGQASWLLADSLAMGFVKMGKIEFETGHVAVYDFDIHRYKSEPDWLNARYWAHPERWAGASS